MTRWMSILLASLLALTVSAAPTPAWAQNQENSDNQDEQADEQAEEQAEAADQDDGLEKPAKPAPPRDPRNAVIEELVAEIGKLRAELLSMREEMAQARLEADLAKRELEELQQFIRDNREYGDDFAQYQAIKEIAEREERIRRQQETRAKREEEMARRRAERNMAAAQQEVIAAEQAEMEKYRRAGFEPLGLDAYLGRTGFFYHQQQQTGARVEYEPFLGRFLEPVQTSYIDYSEMTISGSALNASDEVRNLGIAIAFFDRRGNQVGATTVQINNARPDVPYPFTALVKMALDGPFASSSSWVLYADPVE